MAAPIGPGDWVECVDDGGGGLPLRVGALYCIEAVRSFPAPCGGCSGCARTGFKLAGVTHARSGTAAGFFCSTAFKPIYRPKADLIESLKAPPKSAPVREKEDA